MQRKNEFHTKNSQQSLGICHRLYNFFINTIFSPTLKNLTMGRAPNRETDLQMLLQEQSRRPQDSSLISSSEVFVEFRHEDWTSSVHNHERNEIERVGMIKSQQVEGRSGGEFEGASTNGLKGRGPRKTVTIKENEHQKDKNTMMAKDEDHEQRSIRKYKHPRLLSVDSNINEKSDAFIRNKKEAMRKNFSLEPNHK